MGNEDKGKPEFRRTSSQLARVGKGTSRKLVQMGRFFKTGLVFSLLSVYMAVGAVGANLQQLPPQQNLKDTTMFFNPDTVFMFLDSETIFTQRAHDALLKFLEDNIVYPQSAREAKIEGRVRVTFFVEPDGSLTNFEIGKSVHPDLDEEALRVAKLMPKWKPGTVRVKYEIPVSFHIKE